MPNRCYCTGDAGDHAPFPTFGENMEPTNQAVRVLKGALARCSNIQKYIQRIVLDEIHTIGQDESGTVWEQIILLAPCPIMSVVYIVSYDVRSNVPWLQWTLRDYRYAREIQFVARDCPEGKRV